MLTGGEKQNTGSPRPYRLGTGRENLVCLSDTSQSKMNQSSTSTLRDAAGLKISLQIFSEPGAGQKFSFWGQEEEHGREKAKCFPYTSQQWLKAVSPGSLVL